jgi:hypothetical protein
MNQGGKKVKSTLKDDHAGKRTCSPHLCVRERKITGQPLPSYSNKRASLVRLY